MADIHNAVDQQQQAHVGDTSRHLERHTSGEAGGHQTDGATRPSTGHMIEHGFQIGLHVVKTELCDQSVALPDMIDIVVSHDVEAVARKVIGQRHIVALAFSIPRSQDHDGRIVGRRRARTVMAKHDALS